MVVTVFLFRVTYLFQFSYWQFILKKQGASDRFSRRIVSGPITKDEEEVAETLFALARMFPNNDTNDDFKGKHESLKPNPSGVPESNNSHSLAVEGFLSSQTRFLFMFFSFFCIVLCDLL